jgi:hypothetical protein
MNGFEVADGHKLKVNILTDGPTIATNQREELGEGFIGSSHARNVLMQKLMGDKDLGNIRPAPTEEVLTQT